MRWEEIINESNGHGAQRVYLTGSEDPSEILKNCSDYAALVKATNLWLYRGEYETANKNKPNAREDFQDDVMYPLVYEQVASDALKTAGFDTGRDSLYATTDQEMTEQYGDTWILIPGNGFNCVWSPEVVDFHLEPPAPAVDQASVLYYVPPTGCSEDLPFALASDYNMDQDQYQKIVYGERWYVVQDIQKHIDAGLVTSEKWSTTKKWLEEKTLKLQYVNGHLKNAMESTHEVMLTGPQFYMLPPEHGDAWMQAIQSGSWTDGPHGQEVDRTERNQHLQTIIDSYMGFEGKTKDLGHGYTIKNRFAFPKDVKKLASSRGAELDFQLFYQDVEICGIRFRIEVDDPGSSLLTGMDPEKVATILEQDPNWNPIEAIRSAAEKIIKILAASPAKIEISTKGIDEGVKRFKQRLKDAVHEL